MSSKEANAAGFVGKLTCVVHRAYDLVDRQLIGKQDPYVKLECGSEHFHTHTQNGAGRDATFEQAFIFNLRGKEDMFHVRVMDKEVLSDRSIGRLDLRTRDICLAKKGVMTTYELVDANSFNKRVGKINLTFSFDGPIPTQFQQQAAAESSPPPAQPSPQPHYPPQQPPAQSPPPQPSPHAAQPNYYPAAAAPIYSPPPTNYPSNVYTPPTAYPPPAQPAAYYPPPPSYTAPPAGQPYYPPQPYANAPPAASPYYAPPAAAPYPSQPYAAFPAPIDWACAGCTFWNRGVDSRCAMCQRPR